MNNSEDEYKSLHKEACEQGRSYYRDPKTGYMVFTEVYHKVRGYCCQSGCRHCPYGFKKDPSKKESQ